MGKVDKEYRPMNLVFALDGVISHENKPLINVVEFMQWLKKEGHHITIWTTRENTLENKMDTEKWLEVEQVMYDRLIFDRPQHPIFVDETPPNAKYYRAWGDNQIVADLFEEWKVTLC